MSYQVLARKWRPHRFEEVVGQEHVLRALINALDQQNLHHAYLLTGTRGVGKTTLARILAKCFNCETGITARPCCQCDICQEIEGGHLVDLIEVDAASRTKVEDTRELLDNVPYAPVYSRFKIYLIDEVHMLSGHSFNALLKTLEEPPPHVKFLLATTNPQKLPATVLSRCLQFHLKNLSEQQIARHLQFILTQENVSFEDAALLRLARAAKGSVRDALSLLDQAIAFTQGHVNVAEVHELLGTLPGEEIQPVLRALLEQDGPQLLRLCAELALKGADFGFILDEIIRILHRVAIAQVLPEAMRNQSDTDFIFEMSERLSKEDVQLYYQISVMGRRDLALAVDQQTGFEMTILRLLAFRPVTEEIKVVPLKGKDTVPKMAQTMSSPQPVVNPSKPDKPIPAESSLLSDPAETIEMTDWSTVLAALKLRGALYSLASNCVLSRVQGLKIELTLHQDCAALLNEKLRLRLNEALGQFFDKTIQLIIQVGPLQEETPAQQAAKLSTAQHQAAVRTITQDENIKMLIDTLGATIDPHRIKTL